MHAHPGQQAHPLPDTVQHRAGHTWLKPVRRQLGTALRGPLALLLAVSLPHAGLLFWLMADSHPGTVPAAPTLSTVSVTLLPPTAAVAPPSVAPASARAPAKPKNTSPAKPAVATRPSTQPAQTPLRPAASPAMQTVNHVGNASTPLAAAPLTPPLAQARGLNNPQPRYPELSRRLGEEGQVQLAVLILADGSVAEVNIQRSSGYPRLDSAAVSAVRNWHYQPARRGTTAIDYRYLQPVTFSLND